MFEIYSDKKESKRFRVEESLENGISFIFEDNDGTPELKLKKDREELFDFTHLAPPGTIFEFSHKWTAHKRNDGGWKITVGKSSEAADSILSILHEIGHSQDVLGVLVHEEAKARKMEEKKQDESNSYPKSRLFAIKDEIEAKMTAERNAWAYALRQVRIIERRFNITILNRLADRGTLLEGVKNFTNKHLGTYVKGAVEELDDFDVCNKKQMDAFFKRLEEIEKRDKEKEGRG